MLCMICMYDVWYVVFEELAKLCAYDLCLCFRYSDTIFTLAYFEGCLRYLMNFG